MSPGRTNRAGDAAPPQPVVLIVDDNPDILLLLETNLRRAGFGIVKASDGEIALREIDREPPDVVLLDLMMPVLDGWGVMERLAKSPSAPPVIVISAATSQSNVDRAYAMGAVGYITKPFILTEMIETLNEVLAAAADRGPKPLAAAEPPPPAG